MPFTLGILGLLLDGASNASAAREILSPSAGQRFVARA
jgi:hypothetical protein